MTIKPFPIFDEQSAPLQAREQLATTRAGFGMIPNLEGVMAGAPTLLEAYVSTWALFDTTSFTAVEQQVVYLTVNFENNCEYCVPWHSKLAEEAGMAATEINNLREGRRLSDECLHALHEFTKTVVRTRGSVAPADLEDFFAAGYTRQQAMEVILGIAIKVMSNYTNALAQTPLDSEVESLRWKKPTLRSS